MKISTFTALVTAFRDDETIDYATVAEQARRQIAAGNDLFVCGTNGDFSSLSFAERVSVVQACSEVRASQTRIIANAGCPSTYETALLGKQFARLGVEAVAVITPYFISCTQEGLYRHYARIADSLQVPVYIYEIPARTGNSIDIDTVRRLAKHGNVKGIKDSTGKAERLDVLATIVKANPSFELYVGTDSLILHGLRSGASGCVSGLANVVPAWIRAIADAFALGDYTAADSAQSKVNELRNILYESGYPPAMVKRTLYLMDKAVGNNRLPSLVLDDGIDRMLRAAIVKFGLRCA